MNLSGTLHIRLDPTTKTRLNNVANRSGLKAAALIRQAIMEYCEEAERTGHLPAIRVEENHGSVIGHQENFTTGARPDLKNPRYKIKRPKK